MKRYNTCIANDCNRPTTRKDYCSTHTYRLEHWGSLYDRPTKVTRVCAFDGCGRPLSSRKYCQRHYIRSQAARPLGDITVAERFWSKVAVTANPSKCWLWQRARTTTGYGKCGWNGKTAKAHRVAFELTFGYEPQLLILHSCDRPLCVNPSHLREGTVQDNIQDKVDRCRHRRGQGVPNAKLTERDVLAIRTMKGPQSSIAKRFGVSQSLVGQIKARRVWQHI